MTTAQLKLTAALPEGARATAKRVASRFHLDQVGWFQSAEDARLLPALADAAWNDKRVELRYRRWNDSVTRKVQPLTANENACALISMVARSKCSNQRPDTLTQDRNRQLDENLLQRTAGPYIWVNHVAFAMSALPSAIHDTGHFHIL
jgi:hypothetical protein